MDSITIHPFKFNGKVQAPYSKSYLQRAIAISIFSNHPIEIVGLTKSKDVIAAIGIAKALGCVVIEDENKLTIHPGRVVEEEVVINVGEAGLATRLFSPIASVLSTNVRVVGEGSILSRPMHMVVDALSQLGVDVETTNNFLPFNIKGKLKSGDIQIDGSESSQLLTGLLIALPFVEGDSTISVSDLASIPYVDMTLQILSEFGIEIENQGYKKFIIPGNQKVVGNKYYTEGDWSGASFLLVGGAISGNLTLQGLNLNSAQADKKIIEALQLAGANIEFNNNVILVKNNVLNGFSFDATHCPDLFPPLAVLGVFAKGVTTIKGVTRLKNKESDRAQTIRDELVKLGAKINVIGDKMIIHGSGVFGGEVSSRNDHRIAMMLALMASQTNEPVIIENPKAIEKSFPGFYEFIQKQPLR